MAVPTDTTQTYGVIGRREDLTDEIHNIDPTDTPFMTAIRKGTASNTYHEWQTDSFRAASGTNAKVEGDDIANTALTATVRLGNYTQITAERIQVSTSQRAANNAGRGDELEYQATKTATALKRDMETTMTGNYASVAGNSSTARKSASFEAWIQTNDSRGSGGSNTAFSGGIQAAATDGTQRVFTESLLKDVLDAVFTAGDGRPTQILVGAFNKRQMSGFAGVADSIRDTGSKRATIIGAADVYVGDYHSLDIIPSRFSRTRSALVVDPRMWKLCYYDRFQTKKLAETGLSEARLMFAEWTLEACNEKASGVVADLTTS